jgi:hypothetical protein
MKLLGLAAIPLAFVGLLLGSLFVGAGTPVAQAGSFCLPHVAAGGASYPFDKQQLANAATIIRVGKARGVAPRGWVIAVAAAMQESSLHNLPYGDRDSAGLFQQRPSMGWGSFAQVTNPVYATTAFYGGPDVPPANTGLLDVPGWEQMPITQAAQAVQRSGYPDAYAARADQATVLVHQLAGAETQCPESGRSAGCPPTGRPVEAGLTPDAVHVVRCAVKYFHIANIGGLASSGHINGSDHYTGRAVDLMIDNWTSQSGISFGNRVAAYFIGHAKQYGVTYVIWRAQIWTKQRPYWRPYNHPDGRTDPTALHMDHVHVSVAGNAGTTTQ